MKDKFDLITSDFTLRSLVGGTGEGIEEKNEQLGTEVIVDRQGDLLRVGQFFSRRSKSGGIMILAFANNHYYAGNMVLSTVEPVSGTPLGQWKSTAHGFVLRSERGQQPFAF